MKLIELFVSYVCDSMKRQCNIHVGRNETLRISGQIGLLYYRPML